MKIAHAVPYIRNESAGTTYAVVEMCNSLQRAGCEVTLYVLNPVSNDQPYSFNVRSFDPSSVPHSALGYSAMLNQALTNELASYDVVHSHLLWMYPCYRPCVIASKKNIPFVVSPHGALSNWALRRSKIKKSIVSLMGQKKALANASVFHATSLAEKEQIESYLPNASTFVQPLGVSFYDHLIPGIKKGPRKNLVFMSRIHPKKGLDLLLRVWKKLMSNHRDWDLQIIGDSFGNYSDDLKRLSNHLQLNRVYFLGKLLGDLKRRTLAEASLFVLPTHSENFGLVVPEALALKVPVVCSKGAPWSDLEKFGAGWWIDLSEGELFRCLDHAMSLDAASLSGMGEKGYAYIKESFDWDVIALNLISEYQKLV